MLPAVCKRLKQCSVQPSTQVSDGPRTWHQQPCGERGSARPVEPLPPPPPTPSSEPLPGPPAYLCAWALEGGRDLVFRSVGSIPSVLARGSAVLTAPGLLPSPATEASSTTLLTPTRPRSLGGGPKGSPGAHSPPMGTETARRPCLVPSRRTVSPPHGGLSSGDVWGNIGPGNHPGAQGGSSGAGSPRPVFL